MSNMQQDVKAAMDHSGKGSLMEYRTRRERGFNEFEQKLPDIRASPASDKRPDLTTDVLSHLGRWNPLPHQITANDTVWLFENTAYRSAKSNNWETEFVVAVFDKNTGVEVSKVVADVAEKIGIGRGDAAEATIRERLMPFMQTILPGRIVKVSFAAQTELELGPGKRNGISSDVKVVPEHRDGDIITSVAQVPVGADGILEMKTAFAEPGGWGVISDIDDTIKITQTSDPIGILRSTFVSPPTPVEGMPELYAFLQKVVSPLAPFFYVSASPYNLHKFLTDFRAQYYPHGTIILRDANWMNLSGLLSNLTLGVQEYKVDRMDKINSWLPKRKMICIGDSTQSDPEAYAEIYNKYPGWVRLILIRKVEDIASIGIREKNEPKRFEKAFKDIPKDVWHVFEKPQECESLIQNAVSKG